MAASQDTLLRQLALLSLIPEQPRFSTAPVLQEKLEERGFVINLRSVQRDLVRLSQIFPLLSEDRAGRRQWSFAEGVSLDLRSMEPATALALTLAEEHLQGLLPKSVLDLLGPQFRKAKAYLDGMADNQLSSWSRKVRAVPNGKSLLPAQVAPAVWEATSEALLEHKQLAVSYLARGKEEAREFVLHPAGMVSRQAISYLIASVGDYSDLRQFALHRIQSAEVLPDSAKPHKRFDVDTYIREELNTGTTIQPVELVADIAPNIAWLLRETPLSETQNITAIDGSDWCRLTATVPDDSETQWWVFGLGENIRLYKPVGWQEVIRNRLHEALVFYSDLEIAEA